MLYEQFRLWLQLEHQTLYQCLVCLHLSAIIETSLVRGFLHHGTKPNPKTPAAIAAGATIFDDVSSAPNILLHKDSSSLWCSSYCAGGIWVTCSASKGRPKWVTNTRVIGSASTCAWNRLKIKPRLWVGSIVWIAIRR